MDTPADFIKRAEFIVPNSKKAEEASIGAVLINPDIYLDLANIITTESFYSHRRQWIWQAFNALYERREPIDLLTVSTELERTGKLSEAGGSAYLTSLINQVPSSLNAESYARIVESHFVRRKMIAAANKIASAAYNEELTVQEAQEIASREITSSLETKKDNDETAFMRAISKVIDRAQENYENIKSGKQVNVGTKTGLLDLDQILLGIEDEELVFIGARPGHGKTSILFDIARHNILVEKKKVAIFSLEMSDEQVARRFIAQHAEVDSAKIKTGALTQDEWSRVYKAAELYENGGRVFLSDISNLTPAMLRAKCLKYQRLYGLDLVLVDYIGLMAAGFKAENRTREIGYISRQLKLLVGELKVPILVAAQLNRSGEGRSEKRPILSDLRDSGDIEQDANVVIFLHCDNPETNSVTEAIVAKRRDGRIGSADLVYKREFTKFTNAATRRFAPNEQSAEYAQKASVGSED